MRADTQLHGSLFLESLPIATTDDDPRSRWAVRVSLGTLTLQLTDEQAEALLTTLALISVQQKAAEQAKEES